MIVFSTNPLVKDTVDKAFCLAREHYNVENDEALFSETAVICYLEGYPKELDYATGSVGMTLAARRLQDNDDSRGLLKKVFTDAKTETAVCASMNAVGKKEFTWIVLKIKGFKVDLEKKYVNFNIVGLVANIVKVFSHEGLVKKVNAEFASDIKKIYQRLKELLTLTGTFARVMREWKPREES